MKKASNKKAPREISRQRRWQLQKQKEGKCIICGEDAVTSRYCLKHAIIRREQQRARFGCRKRNKSLTYRLEEEGKAKDKAAKAAQKKK
jgi:hypothetical protein